MLPEVLREEHTAILPLYISYQLSDEEHNEFCQVFHPANREILTNRLFLKNPNHPSDKAYNFKDVFDAALTYFSNVRLHCAPAVPPL